MIIKEKCCILSAYSTILDTLSFKLIKTNFNHNIDYLDLHNDNKISIKGNFNILNDDIKNISRVMVISKTRDDLNVNSFDMNFDCLGDSFFCFDGFLDGVRFFDDRVLNVFPK